MAVGSSDDLAIVVGVNDYADAAITSLRGCVTDAELFAEWLRDPTGGGLDPANISLICSPVPRVLPISRPVKDEVEDAFLQLINRHLQTGERIGRRLYLWFSGHGITPTKTDEDCALLMSNASLVALGRSIPGRRAADNLRKRAMFEEVILFMDCCRGAAGLEEATLSFPDSADPTVAPNVKWLHAFATKWAAASAERMLPHPMDAMRPQSQHGIFTHAVLEGLRNGINLAGEITSDSLSRYVKERTQQLLPLDDNQRPDFLFDPERLIVFGKGTGTPIVVTMTDPSVGFQVRDGGDIRRVVYSVSTASNPVKFTLAPGMYLFASPSTGNAFSATRLVKVLGESLNVGL